MNSPHRICIIAEGQLGDLLILSPALRALRESYPAATLTVLALQRRSYGDGPATPGHVLREDPPGGTCAVIRSSPHVDRVAEI
ncbi:MAG TPA: hypothetical protein VK569_02755, partial [Bacteroidota bacterium]|nr:hypothetical protein [Bacteroidota bacterium]